MVLQTHYWLQYFYKNNDYTVYLYIVNILSFWHCRFCAWYICWFLYQLMSYFIALSNNLQKLKFLGGELKLYRLNFFPYRAERTWVRTRKMWSYFCFLWKGISDRAIQNWLYLFCYHPLVCHRLHRMCKIAALDLFKDNHIFLFKITFFAWLSFYQI